MNEQTDYDTCEVKQDSPLDQSIDRVFRLLTEHQHLFIDLERRLAPVCRPETIEADCAEKACDLTAVSPTVTRILDMAGVVQGMCESVERLTGRLDVS